MKKKHLLMVVLLVSSQLLLPMSSFAESNTLVNSGKYNNIVKSQTTTASDSTIVNIPDSTLKSELINAFARGKSELTYGDVRYTSSKQGINGTSVYSITCLDSDFDGLSSLTGMEVLQELPSGISLDIGLKIKENVSWDPLKNLPINSSAFFLQQDGMGNKNDEELNILNSLKVIPDKRTNNSFYMDLCGTTLRNSNGLNNDQLKLIKPFIDQFYQVGTNTKYNINLGQNSISDYSILGEYSNTKINASNQNMYFDTLYNVNWNNPGTINLQSGIKGLSGEVIQPANKTRNNVSGEIEKNNTNIVINDFTRNYNDIWVYNSAGTTYNYDNNLTLYISGEQGYPIHWISDKQHIDGQDFLMPIGAPEPTAEDFKASATDIEGRSVTVTAKFDKVDFQSPGTYDITLESSDGQSKVVKLTIVEKDNSLVPILRAYNPNDGDHLYTASQEEYDWITGLKWNAEGTAFQSVLSDYEGAVPVYRLYNPNSGEHFYTVSESEYDGVASKGWTKEQVCFYMVPKEKGDAVYRVFNPNATGPGSHLFTSSKEESTWLINQGWTDEGIAFYSAK